jgi:hypothetical protein
MENFRAVQCPACGKRRLNKLILPNGEVERTSLETTIIDEKLYFHDACDFCLIKYNKLLNARKSSTKPPNEGFSLA